MLKAMKHGDLVEEVNRDRMYFCAKCNGTHATADAGCSGLRETPVNGAFQWERDPYGVPTGYVPRVVTSGYVQVLGHGHVFPRPDGVRARCGGPAMCAVCAADLARKSASNAQAADPFADVRDKRVGELNAEQFDRATELWLRAQIGPSETYWHPHLQALFRVIDRLRAQSPTQPADPTASGA